VIVGIVLMIVSSVWIALTVAPVGLIAFGVAKGTGRAIIGAKSND
jgi:hypothetical protein